MILILTATYVESAVGHTSHVVAGLQTAAVTWSNLVPSFTNGKHYYHPVVGLLKGAFFPQTPESSFNKHTLSIQKLFFNGNHETRQHLTMELISALS